MFITKFVLCTHWDLFSNYTCRNIRDKRFNVNNLLNLLSKLLLYYSFHDKYVSITSTTNSITVKTTFCALMIQSLMPNFELGVNYWNLHTWLGTQWSNLSAADKSICVQWTLLVTPTYGPYKTCISLLILIKKWEIHISSCYCEWSHNNI